jgi:hypothetical protein
LLSLASGREVPLSTGTRLTSSQLVGLDPAGPDGVVAEVTSKPGEPHQLGLTNRSRKNWSGTLGDGSRRVVEPGRTLKLAPGTRIEA